MLRLLANTSLCHYVFTAILEKNSFYIIIMKNQPRNSLITVIKSRSPISFYTKINELYQTWKNYMHCVYNIYGVYTTVRVGPGSNGESWWELKQKLKVSWWRRHAASVYLLNVTGVVISKQGPVVPKQAGSNPALNFKPAIGFASLKIDLGCHLGFPWSVLLNNTLVLEGPHVFLDKGIHSKFRPDPSLDLNHSRTTSRNMVKIS